MKSRLIGCATRTVCMALVVVAGWSNAAAAAERVDCSKIEDPGERLACYDRQFRPGESTTSKADAATAAAAETGVPEAVAPETVAPATDRHGALAEPAPGEPAAPPPPGLSEEVAGEGGTPDDGGKRETTFLGDEKVDLTSTIKAILAGEKQKMVFQLENNQIWIQASPRPLPFREGDKVTIRNALLGGYFMRSEKGVNTRVQRIH